MMIRLLNNVKSDQEPKARVRDATGGPIAGDDGDVPSPKMIWSTVDRMLITSALLSASSEVFECRLLALGDAL